MSKEPYVVLYRLPSGYIYKQTLIRAQDRHCKDRYGESEHWMNDLPRYLARVSCSPNDSSPVDDQGTLLVV